MIDKRICVTVLVAGVGGGAIGAGLGHMDLQDGSFVVGAGQQHQIVLQASTQSHQVKHLNALLTAPDQLISSRQIS